MNKCIKDTVTNCQNEIKVYNITFNCLMINNNVLLVNSNIYNMEFEGAKPKVKRDTSRCSDGNIGQLSLDTQYLSGEDSSQRVRHLSVRLCDVLDRVGASAEFRKLRQECVISREIIKSLDYQLEKMSWSCFIFGSSSEGTTTPGLNSDTDILSCRYNPVVANISEAGDGESLLIIRDKHTKPGYVKLQCLYNRQPQTIHMRGLRNDRVDSDVEGRMCLKHLSTIGMSDTIDERNGPADTNINSNCDAVYSFRCSDISEFSSEWILRKRPYTWPLKHMLDKMAQMGCFVVGVGHPASSERNLEWRLSFSLQERELMLSMNIVQHKCYILLKLLKKDLIEPFIGKLISSYHLKTCMFYVIENTRAQLWNGSNLVQCVFLCLHVLLKWVIEGYCANYFIKEENMFDREIHRTQRENAVQHLNKLLSNGCEILFMIKLDCIGDFLKSFKRNFQIENVFLETFTIKIKTVVDAIAFKATLYHTLNDGKSLLQNLECLHSYLSKIKCIKDHTEQQTQEAKSYILPFVHIQLAQAYASLAFSKDEFDAKYQLLQSCKYHIDQSRHCDMTSSRLLEVTIMYKLEQNEQCISILYQLEHEVNRKPFVICQCDHALPFQYNVNHQTELNKLTVASILSKTQTCVRFHNSDTAIVPEALQYEIYRSVNTQHESRHKIRDRWMNTAVVDAEVYLHFMEYLVYATRSELFHKHLAINKLILALERGQYFRHRETGYNILGWIHFHEGWNRPGIQCFRQSWSIRPHHNAAKFHIMFYIFGNRNYKL